MKPARHGVRVELAADWRGILEAIQRAPITDALRFVASVRADLDRAFPQKDRG